MSDFDTLAAEQRIAVREAIELMRRSPAQRTVAVSDGTSAYAKWHPSGGVSWGVIGKNGCWCIARGIEP